MSMQLIPSTRASLLADVSIKGSLDYIVGGDAARRDKQQRKGDRIMNSGVPLPKDLDFNEQNLSAMQFVPQNGYLPVTLVNRGHSYLEESLKRARNLTREQVKKRPRYTIDPRISQLATENFEQIVRPRLSLMQSEQAAFDQLKRAAGIYRPMLQQLPLVDEQNERIYKTLQNQASYAAVNPQVTASSNLMLDQQPPEPTTIIQPEMRAPDPDAWLNSSIAPINQLGPSFLDRSGLEIGEIQKINQLAQDQNVPIGGGNLGGRLISAGTLGLAAAAVGLVATGNAQALGQAFTSQQTQFENQLQLPEFIQNNVMNQLMNPFAPTIHQEPSLQGNPAMPLIVGRVSNAELNTLRNAADEFLSERNMLTIKQFGDMFISKYVRPGRKLLKLRQDGVRESIQSAIVLVSEYMVNPERVVDIFWRNNQQLEQPEFWGRESLTSYINLIVDRAEMLLHKHAIKIEPPQQMSAEIVDEGEPAFEGKQQMSGEGGPNASFMDQQFRNPEGKVNVQNWSANFGERHPQDPLAAQPDAQPNALNETLQLLDQALNQPQPVQPNILQAALEKVLAPLQQLKVHMQQDLYNNKDALFRMAGGAWDYNEGLERLKTAQAKLAQQAPQLQKFVPSGLIQSVTNQLADVVTGFDHHDSHLTPAQKVGELLPDQPGINVSTALMTASNLSKGLIKTLMLSGIRGLEDGVFGEGAMSWYVGGALRKVVAYGGGTVANTVMWMALLWSGTTTITEKVLTSVFGTFGKAVVENFAWMIGKTLGASKSAIKAAYDYATSMIPFGSALTMAGSLIAWLLHLAWAILTKLKDYTVRAAKSQMLQEQLLQQYLALDGRIDQQNTQKKHIYSQMNAFTRTVAKRKEAEKMRDAANAAIALMVAAQRNAKPSLQGKPSLNHAMQALKDDVVPPNPLLMQEIQQCVDDSNRQRKNRPRQEGKETYRDPISPATLRRMAEQDEEVKDGGAQDEEAVPRYSERDLKEIFDRVRPYVKRNHRRLL